MEMFFSEGWNSHNIFAHVNIYESGSGRTTYVVIYSRLSTYFATWVSVSGSNFGIWALRAKNRASAASIMRKTYSIATWTGISF